MPVQMTIPSSAQFSRKMYRPDGKGGWTEVEADRDEYVNPKPGHYVLEVTGVSGPFPMDDIYNPGTEVMKVRVELTVRDHEKAARNGKMFSLLMKFSPHEKATLGKIVRCVRGEVQEGEDFDLTDILGGKFQGMVGETDGGNPNLPNGSIMPLGGDDDEDDEDNPFKQ